MVHGQRNCSCDGVSRIGWLERSSREKEENVSTLIQNMKIESNDIIADIGAGSVITHSGMAPLANGVVYAVDIQSEMLAAINRRIELNKIKNIKTILGNEKSINCRTTQ